jgi:DNA-binding IclR family transcriptional regulator
MAYTGAPAATARRDLGHLVELGALRRTGQLKGTRYWLVHAHEDLAEGDGIEEHDA